MKSKNKINEALSGEDMDKIRLLIRNELAQIFFDLYRKKNTWSKP